jgi:hypothetical protein
MHREQFANAGVSESARGILGENREMNFKAVPPDAPAWVQRHITEYRTAVLAGRETRGMFSQRCGAPVAAVVRGVKKLARMVWTPEERPHVEQSTFEQTTAEARAICRKNGITHWTDEDGDEVVVSRRRALLNALLS